MAELETDADVGVTSEGLESDADVGVKSAPNTDSPFPQPVMDKANQFAMSPGEFEMSRYGSGMEDVAKAFGKSFYEAWGPERLGLSDESTAWLNKHGIFTHFEDEKTNPFSAFGALFGAAASVLDGANRTMQAGYRGAQTAGVEMGLPKDVVSIPDAFMGSPHPTGIPKPYVRPTKIEPVKIADTPAPIARPRAELAQTGIPHVDAILNSEPERSVINNPVIDRSHTVPNSWSGSNPTENPTTYISKDFPKEIEVEGIKYDPAEPAAARENAEAAAYKALIEGGMAPDAAQRVAFHDVGNPVENAWYGSHGIDPDKANAKMQPYIDRIAERGTSERSIDVKGTRNERVELTRYVDDQSGDPKLIAGLVDRSKLGKETVVYRGHSDVGPLAGYQEGFVSASEDRGVAQDSGKIVSKIIVDADAPALRVRDHALNDLHSEEDEVLLGKGRLIPTAEPNTYSFVADDGIPPDMFRGMYPDDDPAKTGPGPIEKPTEEESAQARGILERKFMNGRAATVQDVLNTARDLDVIGPPKPEPTFDGSPSEQAEKAWPTSLSSAATEEPPAPRGHAPGEYDQRGKEWVAKIDEPDDVRSAIEGIASDHDWFPEARGGKASPAARKAVAEAAGMDPADLNEGYFSEHFDSDGKVRSVIQVLRQTAKDVAEAAEKNVKEPSVENAATLAEAELRHTHVLEYTMGLRAESGRTLAAWKDLLRETEHTKATTEIRKKEVAGDTPKGTADVVDAVKDVQDNLKNVAKGEAKPGKKLGIQNLIDQAKKLAEGEMAPKEPGAERAPVSPEIKELTDAAKKVLKRFGADKDAGLDAFREELDRLSAGSGKLDSAVSAARELIKANEKPPRTGEPKPPTDRAQLTAAAKRLVAAADNAAPEAKTPMPAKTRSLMEAARQAVGRLKTQTAYPELAEFRRVLSEGDAKAAQAVAKRLVDAEAVGANPIPRQFRDIKLDTPSGKTDVTGLWFLDGNKPVYATATSRSAEQLLGERSKDLEKYGSLNGRDAENNPITVWFKSGEESKARDVIRAFERPDKGGPDYHMEMGRALGYPEDKVQNYIRPPVEHDVVMAAARKLAEAGTEAAAKEKPTLPKDITDLLEQAKDAAKEFGDQQKSVLNSLVDQAEQQAVNMTKSKAVKNPVEALPPELQALVDKTQRVTDRFGGTARPERAALLLARTGKTAAEQEQLARSVAGLTPNQVAKVLNKVSTSKLAERPSWYYWLWQQGLISGLITHSKYLVVNTGQIITERFISPMVAAGIGKLRGENASLMAPVYGNMAMIHQVPDALAAAGEAFRTGQRVPLASEMRLFERGEESPQAKGAVNPYDVRSQGPDWGVWKRAFNEDQLDSAARVLGIPGRSANMIHTFFKVLSERAAAATQAAETAHSEGVTGDRFQQRYQYHLDNPTDDALRTSVNEAYSGAFMEKLEGGWAKASSAMNNFPIVGKWLFPFRHIPINIVRKGVEYSPAAVLDSEFRSALKGDKGAPAQNLALAKITVGTSIIGYFLHKGMADEATSSYPTDPKERLQWQLTGKQPMSVRMGDQWVSIDRLGPMGIVANMGSALGSIVRHYDGQDDDALSKAFVASAMAAVNILGNEAGFQSLRNAIDAMNGDEKKIEKFLSGQAASVVPTLISQPASAIDPYQRKADDLISALKYRVPWLRESLPVKRDPLYGEPLPNPGYHALFRSSQISNDPVRADLDRLKIYPTQPQNNIGGVKLPPDLYDKYQQLHGEFTKQLLGPVVNSPGWLNVPPFARAEAIQALRKSATESAKAQMQGMHQQIITQGMKDTVSNITGAKKTKLEDAR